MWVVIVLVFLAIVYWLATQKKKNEPTEIDKPMSVGNVTLEKINMKSVKIEWDLPTTRASGFPLAASDIAEVEVSMSADAGQNWVVIGSVLPDGVQEFLQTELEIGDWHFRLVVVDTNGLRSANHDEVATVPDETAPSALANVIVTII
jgi:hypothetical protein